MKIGIKLLTALSAVALMGNAMAASITIPSPTVVEKGTSAILNLSYTGDATSTNFDFTINYDETVVDESGIVIDCTNKPPELGLLSCNVNTTTNKITGIGANFTTDVLSSTSPFATLTLPVLANAATGDAVNTFNADFYEASNGDSTGAQSGEWTLTVTDGPQPVYGSNPAAAAGVSMSGQISTIIAADVIVNNNAGADGSTLTYDCTETSDPSGKFSYGGDTTNFDVPKGNTGTISIGCDSSAIGNYSGEMTCSSNGGADAVYALSCAVNAGPEPAFSGDAVGLAMVADEEGDANPAGSVTVTNIGDANTTLTGTCSLTGPDSEISLSGGAFSVNQGAAGAVMAVSCDASAEGSFSNTLSCSHNGTNVATPVEYAVSCEVGPPGPAIYQSNPAPNATIEMTPSDVPVDAVVPNQVLTITNAAPEANDRPLEVTGCSYVGDAAITVGAPPASPIAPMASSTATFSCDTSAVGDYNGTYTCSYAETGGAGPVAVAAYPVHCGVRAAGSELEVSPTPSSVLSIVVGMNGTGTATLTFSEILDEGEDATVDSCTLADGTNFVILTAFPLTVPAGGTAQVQVQGTDPANGSLLATDELTCNATDSLGEHTGFWNLVLTVQTAAIPTLSTWGLLAMFLTMLSLGGIVIRRKARG